MARAHKHAAKDELHGRRARPDRVYRGEGLEPQQEDSRNAAIKCAKVQTLVKVTSRFRRGFGYERLKQDNDTRGCGGRENWSGMGQKRSSAGLGLHGPDNLRISRS